MRTGHAEPHRRQGHGAAGGGAPAIVNSVESEEAIVARLPPRGECREPEGHTPGGRRGARPFSRTPAEAAIALAMDLVAVVGGLSVAGRLREGLEVNSLRGTQGFQHGIEPLPRPLQQAAEPRMGTPSGDGRRLS